MTSAISGDDRENSGRRITRPRRASNHSVRPSTANAIGVVANASKAAASGRRQERVVLEEPT